MVDLVMAIRALDSAREVAGYHKPGHLFRVPGFPGVYSDGKEWVIDVNDRGQDWRLKGENRLIKARWPA